MSLSVLSEDWLPPRLRYREAKVQELRELAVEGAVIVGPSGVGKSTLVRMALPEAITVDCGSARTAASIAARISVAMGLRSRRLGDVLRELRERPPHTIVLDDYTLARRNRSTVSLVRVLANYHRLVLVVHPHALNSPGVFGTVLRMPPYTPRELQGILEDRVVKGALPVSEEAIAAVSSALGSPQGPGSARLALTVLRETLRLCLRSGDREVTPKHVAQALALLGLGVSPVFSSSHKKLCTLL